MTGAADELCDYAARLARGAAGLILDRLAQSGDLDIDVKSTSTDLVTDVDRASERFLLDRIRRDRPDDAVLGEEGGSRSGSSGVRWLVDPIDGTVNFVLGLPLYAVSVAAELDGAVVAGAVINPVRDELYTAWQGGGAWLGERRLRGPRPITLDRAVIGTGFGYDRDRRRRQGEIAARLLGRVADIRRMGSAALDLCAVAAGQLDGYYESGLNPWDYAAGALIAAEAGCVTTGLHGRAPDSRFTAAAGPDLAPDLFAVLDELNADEI